HFLTAEGLLGARNALRVQTMTLPDIYQDQASPKEMYEQAQLMAGDIAARVERLMGVPEETLIGLRA
ncbi:MAG: hypothetical protein AAGH41_04095, partial [Pseudomonadota bacterium]